MKKATYISIFFLITALFFAFQWNKAEETNNLLSIGSKAPMAHYEMLDVSGEKLSLDAAKNDIGLLVIFSCNTCPFVIAWEDRYKTISNLCKETNIGMLAINSNEAKRSGDDSFEAMKTHAKEESYDFYYTVDEKSELAKAFGATKTPQVFLFDKNLTLVYTGAIDDNLKDPSKVENHYLKNAITNLKNGEKINPSSTKALGCSIKKVKATK